MLNAGTVVEKGTHDELLTKGGRYASMWEKQIRAERALDAAREAQRKAARAVRRANMQGDSPTVPSRDGYNSLASSGTLASSVLKAGVSLKSDELTSGSSSGSPSSSDAESTHTDENSEDHDDHLEERDSARRRIY